MSKKENKEIKNEEEIKKFEDMSKIKIDAQISNIIDNIEKIVGVYYELQFKTAFKLDIQLYNSESRIWLETDLRGIKGMLYSFNIDLIDEEALKYFNALQIALFKRKLEVDGLKIDFTYEISERKDYNI